MTIVPLRAPRLRNVLAVVLAGLLTVTMVPALLPSAQADEGADPAAPGLQLTVTALRSPWVVVGGRTVSVRFTVTNPSARSAPLTGSLTVARGWDAGSISATVEPKASVELVVPVTAPNSVSIARITPLVRSIGTLASTTEAATLISLPIGHRFALDAGAAGSRPATGFTSLADGDRLTARSDVGWRGDAPTRVANSAKDTSVLTGGVTADRSVLALRTGTGLHRVSVLTGSQDRQTVAPDLKTSDSHEPGRQVKAGSWRWTTIEVRGDRRGLSEINLDTSQGRRWQVNAVVVWPGSSAPGSSHSGSSASKATPRWTAGWTAPAMGAGAESPYLGGLDNQTVRNVIHVGSGGDQVRVRVSNVWGTQPLTVNRASVARRSEGAAVAGRSVRRLTFGGRSSVTVPAGSDVLSDPVPYPVAAGTDLAVSVYLPRPTGTPTWHQQALSTSYLAPGDRAQSTSGKDFIEVSSWFFVSGVELYGTQSRGTIVTLGDSITDGVASTPNANRRYPDYLARRLQREPAEVRYAVANAGIGGNRLLTNSFGSERLHESALRRFDRDVLAVPGVTAVVVLLGTNDLASYGGNPDGTVATLDDFVRAYNTMIERAHAAGVTIVGATIPPSGGPGDSTAVRQQVNDWVRSSAGFDAVFDVDAVLDDPEAPGQIRPDLDGDRVHPNDAGYAAMAKRVPLPAITGTVAPQVVATASPLTGDGPATVKSTVAATSPDGARITGYRWDLQDGTSAEGTTVRHTFSPGAYPVRVVATDDRGRTGVDVIDLTFGDPCKTLVCRFVTPTDDTYVRDGGDAGNNFGAEPKLVVKTAATGFTRQTLLRFDLSELDPATDSTVVLRLHADRNPTIGVRLSRVADDWTEQRVTWRSRPESVGDATVDFTAPDAGWYDVDITAVARPAITAGATTLSVSLAAVATTSSDHTFAAKELDGGASAAKLVIAQEGPS